MLGNSLKHIAFKTANRIHFEHRRKSRLKPLDRDIPRVVRESVLYEDKETLNLLIRYLNKGFDNGRIKSVKQKQDYVLLADFQHFCAWLVLLDKARNITGIRRY